jgi:hypothetical protein
MFDVGLGLNNAWIAGYELGPCGGLCVLAVLLETVPAPLQADKLTASSKPNPE